MRVARKTPDGIPCMIPSRPMRRAPRSSGRSAELMLRRRAVAVLQRAGFNWNEIAVVLDRDRSQVAKYVRQNRQLRDEVLQYAG